MGRTLRASDFGPGKISYFVPDSFGANWKKVQAELAIKTDEFARRCRVPVSVSSSFRTPAQNALAGGSAASEHLSGRAVDLLITDRAFFSNLPKYITLARSIGFRGLGIYEGKQLLHLDIRETPGSWAKLASGRMVDLASGLRVFLATKAGKAAGGFAVLAGLLLLAVLSGRRSGPPGSS